MDGKVAETIIILITYSLKFFLQMNLPVLRQQKACRLVAMVDLNLIKQFVTYECFFDQVYYVAFSYSNLLFIDHYSEIACQCIEAEQRLSQHIQLLNYSEGDIELAAYLRTRFNIAGMNYQQARVFRDKMQFKNILQANHISVPKGFYLDNNLSVKRLYDQCIQSLGLPFVIKPIHLAGGLGVEKITSYEQFQSVYNNHLPTPYLAEEWIEGQLFHMDGLFNKGTVPWFGCSQYNLPLIVFASGYSIGSIPLLELHPLYKKFHEQFKQIASLISEYHGIIHLEAFISDSGKLFILEASPRPGGGLIVSIYNRMFGYNLVQSSLASIFGVNYEISVVSGLSYFWLYLPQKHPIFKRLSRAHLKATYELTINNQGKAHASQCIIGQFNYLLAYHDDYEELSQEFMSFEIKKRL